MKLILITFLIIRIYWFLLLNTSLWNTLMVTVICTSWLLNVWHKNYDLLFWFSAPFLSSSHYWVIKLLLHYKRSFCEKYTTARALDTLINWKTRAVHMFYTFIGLCICGFYNSVAPDGLHVFVHVLMCNTKVIRMNQKQPIKYKLSIWK